MTSILKPLLPIRDQPGMPEAIAGVIAAAVGKVCQACGLERMGHAPETSWLGYAPHEWTPVPANAEMVKRARALTVQAYRQRPTK